MDPNELPLRDIHLPEAVSWWPLAWGWWGLGLVVLVVLLLLIRWRAKRRADPLSTLKGQLAEIEQNFQADGDARALAAGLSRLLRLGSLRLGVRSEVAAATGSNWLNVLDSFLPAESGSRFDSDLGRLFTVLPYQARPTEDANALLSLVKHWFDHAQPPPRSSA